MNPSAPTLLIGTLNEAKAARIRSLLEGIEIIFADTSLCKGFPEPSEEGSSHREIAENKAIYWSKVHNGPAITSDGGLLIPALGANWSSLYTKRLLGQDINDQERALELLRLVYEQKISNRRILFAESIAIAVDGVLFSSFYAEGLNGILSENYIQPNSSIPGFWIDGLWIEPETGQRLWEISREQRVHLQDPWEMLASKVRTALHQLMENF